MEPKPLEVMALDCYAGDEFILYFSDETYATVSATELAECFPERKPIPPPEADYDAA